MLGLIPRQSALSDKIWTMLLGMFLVSGFTDIGHYMLSAPIAIYRVVFYWIIWVEDVPDYLRSVSAKHGKIVGKLHQTQVC
jgi:hypothetical protein